MAYVKNNWVDREGTTRYFETVDDDGALIFTPDYTQVTELGTPVNADNMNHIEEGIAAGSFTKFDLNTTYAKDDLVTVIEDGSPVIYKSLVDNNIGNALSSSIAWEKISLGGGGGLEIGDIGIAPLGIDETKGKRRYLNGQLIIQDQYVQFTNKVKTAVELYPSLACTEEEWQTTATMTVGGQVGKFVIDDEAGTIRLPRIIMPIQNLTDLNSLAEIVTAGLPNIEGTLTNTYGGGLFASSGAFELTVTENFGRSGSGSSQEGNISFSSSLSNPIYGNSTTVQQEQIQYPYFIQVATGSETEDNIVNEIELNNPFSLLDYKFSEYELNNISWLRSNNQFEPKTIYPSVYDLLLKIYNGTEEKAGVSVKLFGEEYTDYDFVLNTAEETFRLPVKVKLASGKAIAGNGMALGLTNGIENFVIREAGDKSVSPETATYGATLPTTTKVSSAITEYATIGITTDSTKSGIETSDNGLYLYFYVGETVQNANLINAGRIEEKLSHKIDINSGYVDGQWVASVKELSTATAVGTYTIDLSDYLPNDDYNYEVYICCIASVNTQNLSSVYFSSSIIEQSGFFKIIQGDKGGSYGYGSNSVILPIGSDHIFNFIISGNKLDSNSLTLKAYRRIGTNQ